VLVDSNIIIYSLDVDSPKYHSAVNFIESNRGKLYFAHQNVLEALRVITHPTFYKMVGRLSIEALDRTVERGVIVSPTENAYLLALELIKKYELNGNNIFDGYLVATALSNGIDIIATDNERHFKKFKEIQVYNPFKQ
jgi:predicted nucleic acid-binding protein